MSRRIYTLRCCIFVAVATISSQTPGIVVLKRHNIFTSPYTLHNTTTLVLQLPTLFILRYPQPTSTPSIFPTRTILPTFSSFDQFLPKDLLPARLNDQTFATLFILPLHTSTSSPSYIRHIHAFYFVLSSSAFPTTQPLFEPRADWDNFGLIPFRILFRTGSTATAVQSLSKTRCRPRLSKALRSRL
jgi:hypothetical protein